MQPRQLTQFIIAGLVLIVGLVACSGDGEEATGAKKRPALLVTVVDAQIQDVQVSEFSVGRIESLADPVIAAEVEGRVLELLVQIGDPVEQGQVLARIDAGDYELSRDGALAEIGRLEEMIEQQQRLVNRYEKLRKDKFFSENALDEANSQLRALGKQVAGAKARLEQARRDLGRTSIKAPLSGKIEQRMVSEGDFVRPGGSIFRLSTDESLRVVLPFPESLSNQLQAGQRVILESPVQPGKLVEAKITELRPTVGSTNRAMEALVDLNNPGGWKAGASVSGELVLAVNEDAVVVPEICLAIRPAGRVVYVYNPADSLVEERIVEVGVQRDGWVEIVSGLSAGETVVADGAAFLSGGVEVRLPVTEE